MTQHYESVPGQRLELEELEVSEREREREEEEREEVMKLKERVKELEEALEKAHSENKCLGELVERQEAAFREQSAKMAVQVRKQTVALLNEN